MIQWAVCRLFPVQQLLLALPFADLGEVLADLQASAAESVGIACGKVANIDKFAAQLYPELGRVT